jgi:aryl sulfotransferase
MKIIQIGHSKSGNFWLYSIIQAILHGAEIPISSFIKDQPIYSIAQSWDLSYENQADIDVLDIEGESCYYRISSIFRMPVIDLEDYLSRATHVWSHSPYCPRSQAVLPKFDKIIYLIRDPRDRAISAANFRFTPYGQKYLPHNDPDPETWLRRRYWSQMYRWVNHVGGFLSHAEEMNIHVVFYERLLHNFDQELQSLLAYLNLDLSSEVIDQIKMQVDFSTMKAENPQHVRRGKAGRWKSVLSNHQKRITILSAGPYIRYLGYPDNRTDLSQVDQPSLPSPINHGIIKRGLIRGRRVRNLQRLLGLMRLIEK